MYTAFADVYDRLMDDVPYEKWAAHYLFLLEKYGAAGKKCVECACGTGRLTIPLQKSGMKMTGMDLSAQMLEKAMVSARNAGLFIPFIQQDMCRLSVPTRVQAVLCTCDGLNYLLTNARALQFFKAAFSALKPGGVLLFDVSTPYKLEHILGSGTRTFAADDYAYIWNNRWSTRRQTVTMDLTIFAKNASGAYNRTEETQVQRAYDRETLTALLQKAGFETVRFYGNFRKTTAKETDERWHVAALKPQIKGD